MQLDASQLLLVAAAASAAVAAGIALLQSSKWRMFAWLAFILGAGALGLLALLLLTGRFGPENLWFRTPAFYLAAIVLLGVVVAPGVPMLRPIRTMGAELDGNWYDALRWMAINTPQPFQNPDEYYRASRGPAAVADYGVLAWWDYGYWITRVARRVPVTNPRQSGIRDAASFFVTTNEADANRIAERLGIRGGGSE